MKKLGEFFDSDEDRAVDKALAEEEKAQAAPATEVPTPEPIDDEELTGPELAAKPSMLDATDEELEAELRRRKARTIDGRIADAMKHLAALQQERAALLGLPVTAVSAPTQVNPFTGKVKAPKVQPGSVPREQCTCEDGCYRCTKP